MLNNIYLKFSEYALLRDGQHPFANKYGATAEAIFTEYTTNEDIVNSSVEDLVAFINSKSKGRIADPEETAKILQAEARNSYWLNKCLYEPLTISIASSGKVYSAGILAEDKHMSKAGNRYLRYCIIEATGSVIRHCPEYKDFILWSLFLFFKLKWLFTYPLLPS